VAIEYDRAQTPHHNGPTYVMPAALLAEFIVQMKHETIFSNDGGGTDGLGAYRYTLWRDVRDLRTSRPEEYLMIIGLNPSTTTAIEDDNTILTCIRVTRRLGFGWLLMANLFALRETLPENMKQHPAPIGPDNDRILLEYATGAGLILCAWGCDGSHLNRASAIAKLLAGYKLHCLRKNRDGSPGHPLYLPALTPEP
jgi:hypothetical protein